MLFDINDQPEDHGVTQGKESRRRAFAGYVDAIQRVQSLSLNLRLSLLDDLGLIATLRWYAERHSSEPG
jgi:signal transduction histidine kinase